MASDVVVCGILGGDGSIAGHVKVTLASFTDGGDSVFHFKKVAFKCVGWILTNFADPISPGLKSSGLDRFIRQNIDEFTQLIHNRLYFACKPNP